LGAVTGDGDGESAGAFAESSGVAMVAIRTRHRQQLDAPRLTAASTVAYSIAPVIPKSMTDEQQFRLLCKTSRRWKLNASLSRGVGDGLSAAPGRLGA
jgi:hypothetical protein